jgi:hypothetical protein
MTDFSFLRLKETFAEALKVDDFTNLDLRYWDTIRLSPKENYLQTTNLTEGFSFNGNYRVYLIDLCQKVLVEITDNVAIEEFTDENGKRQFSFELLTLGQDFQNEPICLKFVHTVSDSVLYSNPFVLTEYDIENTIRFDYRSYGNFEGVDYGRSLKTQSIRVAGYFTGYLDETETKNYYQISTSNTVSSRSLIKRGAKYHIQRVNAFSFFRYNLVLNHDVIYLNGVRVTNKTILKASEQEGASNVTGADFNVYTDLNDTFTPELQIFEVLGLLTFEPTGNYTPQL